MVNYLGIMIARAEHENMIRSLPKVPEYGENIRESQPGWLSQHVGQVLQALGSGLTSAGERMNARGNVEIETTLSGPEQEGATS